MMIEGRRIAPADCPGEEPLGVNVLGCGINAGAGSVVGRAAIFQAQLVGQDTLSRAVRVERHRQFQRLGGQVVEQFGDASAVVHAQVVR